MADWGPLGRTPYFFSARRSFRQERLLSYIRREHRRGRHLDEILDDAYVRRCGSHELLWATLRESPLIELLEQDVREALQQARAALAPDRRPSGGTPAGSGGNAASTPARAPST